jgi:hypothetical protein
MEIDTAFHPCKSEGRIRQTVAGIDPKHLPYVPQIQHFAGVEYTNIYEDAVLVRFFKSFPIAT